MNRGSLNALGCVHASVLGFNEAPIHESGKSGRDLVDVTGDEDASMRPRFMNRGSGDLQNADHALLRASMRPRFMNRGSTGISARPSAPLLPLQ